MISIIIPNNNKDITQLLSSINNSTYRDVEVIEVNEGLERSIQRNMGIDKAKGKYLLIPDSDWILSPDLLLECVKLIKHCNGVYIPEVITTKGLFAKIRNWERQFYTGTPIDVVRFVRRGCPRFDELMSGPEDSDWDRQIPEPKLICKSPYYHYDQVRFVNYFKKKAYYSKSMKRFAIKNPNDLTLNWKWRCFGVFLEKGKWKKFLSNPLMALCVLGLIFIRGIIYHINK